MKNINEFKMTKHNHILFYISYGNMANVFRSNGDRCGDYSILLCCTDGRITISKNRLRECTKNITNKGTTSLN